MKVKCNDLESIVSHAIEEMKSECKEGHFSLDSVNVSELSRRTGISRSRLRTWKKKGGSFSRKKRSTPPFHIMDGYSSLLDGLLSKGISNSVVCLDYLRHEGFPGSLSTVKEYISAHKDLLPPKHRPVEGLGTRGRRYTTKPGTVFQMDWGFVNVETESGDRLRAACFAMICHHCGECYLEFFPNARQENLFIGMIHAFRFLGVPTYVLTDNMKSVVIGRTLDGQPIWQHDYAQFMQAIGFRTKLCKPRHPYTKGKVERFIRYAKDNLVSGINVNNLNDLNSASREWCNRQNSICHAGCDLPPEEVHSTRCSHNIRPLQEQAELMNYLCPIRRISFDGFITYEGRRFGVPGWYTRSCVRVCREYDTLTIYSEDLHKVLKTYTVTWSRRDSCCLDQFSSKEPEELPTMPVRTVIHLEDRKSFENADFFKKFDFAKEGPEDE